MYMNTVNVVEFKSHLSEYLKLVGTGEQVQICNRNVAVAVLSPVEVRKRNRTKLGSGAGTVEVKCDLTQPAMEEKEWEMLG